jgi:site-specific recombinase XerD
MAPRLEQGRQLFLSELRARGVSTHTVLAYATDIRQFIAYLEETNLAADRWDRVERADLTEYLSDLARQGRTGVTRARKLASLRECCRFLAEQGYLLASPAAAIAMPRKERTARVYLRPDEYTRLLSAAGGHSRDFAILQLFLQTGIRVAELVHLTIRDVDLDGRTLQVAGKGSKERIIDLEKRSLQALKHYLHQRPQSLDDHLFLNYAGTGLSDRGVKKLVEKYRVQAGITKQISCHSLRHTFATYKAERGVSAFQIQQWLGHSSVTTSQIYVHLGRTAAKKAMEVTSL